ncbi:MAG: Rnase Y domain-containing protein, partial [Planctomycetaceae bacterium]
MTDFLIGALIALAPAFLAGFFLERIRRGGAYQTRDQILGQARKDAENLLKEKELAAKEDLLRRREDMEHELNETRDELREQERRLDKRENVLGEQQEDIIKKERMLESTQKKLAEKGRFVEEREKELEHVLHQQQEELYRISGLGRDAAAEMLLSRLEQALRNEAGTRILKYQSELKSECDRQAREVIAMAVQRYAAAHTSETTVSSVDIPSDEMKGRIIGREGRNIRAFEKATGVDVIVDDTPGVVIVSAFDNVRREVAKLALKTLIQDGRIHPSRIEEVVIETHKEMDVHIRLLGQE